MSSTIWRLRRCAFALALAVSFSALALLGLRGVPVAQAAGACAAAATAPCIKWSGAMIYAGQNSGNPEGPVGEHASVHGTKFPPGSYTLALVKGDVNASGQSPVEFCKQQQNVAVGGTVTAAGDGTFDTAFDWPAAASSGQWSICAYLAAGASTPAGNVDDGPFSVLSANAPSVAISSASIAPGDTLTVTGHNWLPAQDGILVYIGSCADCDGQPVASTRATSGPDGSFTVTLPIPATAAAGSFIVSANAHSGVLDLGTANAKHVNIVAAKPTATASPSPTGTTTAAAVTPPPANKSSDNTGLIIVLVVGVVVLLLALAGLLAYVLTRRKPTPGDPEDGKPAYGLPEGYQRPPGPGRGGYGSRPDYGSRPGFGAPYGAPPPPPQRGNLWGGDWDDESTSTFPGQGAGQTGWDQQSRTRQASPYPGDDAPTNPENLPPEDPWGRYDR